MSRGLWFVAGAGAGVYVMTRARRVAESLTADGIRDRVHGIAHGARLFREEVRTGQAEREVELRERLGLVPPLPTSPELAAAPPPDPMAATTALTPATTDRREAP